MKKNKIISLATVAFVCVIAVTTYITNNNPALQGESVFLKNGTPVMPMWEKQASFTKKNLTGVSYVGETGYAVGELGSVHRYKINNGWTSASQTTSMSTTAKGVFFTDSVVGWLVGTGGQVRYTLDGGNMWETPNSSIFPNNSTLVNFTDVYFTDTNTGWITGDNGTILKTTNGGISWEKAQIFDQTNEVNLLDFELSDITFGKEIPTRGWVIAKTTDQNAIEKRGMILATEDGGATWEIQTQSTPEYYYTSISIIDSTTGYALTNTGKIFITTNGGDSWTPKNDITLPANTTTIKIIAVPNQRIIVLGKNNSNSFVWESFNMLPTDSLTWMLSSTIEPGMNDIYYTSKENGWIVGNSGVVYKANYAYFEPPTAIASNTSTVTASETPVPVDNGVWNEKNIFAGKSFTDITFLNQTLGFFGGASGSLYKFNGSTLTDITALAGMTTTIEGIDFIDQNHGWVVGNASSQMRKTSDGGASWAIVDTNLMPSKSKVAAFNGIAFTSADYGYAIGNKGLLWKTTNGGVNWKYTAIIPTSETRSQASYHFTSIDSIGGHFWVGINVGNIYHLVPGATSWKSSPLGVAAGSIISISMADINNGYLGTSNGFVYKTTNGGTTWTKLSTPSNSAVISLKAFTTSRIVGITSNDVFESTNGGQSWTITPLATQLRDIDFDGTNGWIIDGNGKTFMLGS